MSLELSVSHIIHVVLDEIFHLTQIDPTFISPDDSLEMHLGLDRKAKSDLLGRSAKKLQISLSQDDLKGRGSQIFTLREMVNFLQNCSAQKAVRDNVA